MKTRVDEVQDQCIPLMTTAIKMLPLSTPPPVPLGPPAIVKGDYSEMGDDEEKVGEQRRERRCYIVCPHME
jgi:hypothetical protein